MQMITEESGNEVSIEKICQKLRETKVQKVCSVNECRPQYLKKDGMSMREWSARMINVCLEEKCATIAGKINGRELI